MSEREKALHLLEAIDDEKMVYVVGILENLTGFANDPNEETISAIAEGNNRLDAGTGQRYEGTTEEFFQMILEE